MFRLLLCLAIFSAPAFARPHSEPRGIPDIGGSAPTNRDAEAFERTRSEAMRYKADQAQATREALVQNAAGRFAAKIAQDYQLGGVVMKSQQYSTYYFSAGGWQCRVSVSYYVTGGEGGRECQNYFSGQTSCTTTRDTISERYQDFQPRALENDGRCFEPRYDLYWQPRGRY